MTHEYRLSIRNLSWHWWPMFLAIATAVIVAVYASRVYSPNYFRPVLTQTLFVLGLIWLVDLALQLRYVALSKGIRLQFNPEDSLIRLTTAGGIREFHVDDIKSIQTTVSLARSRRSTLYWLPWDTSGYSEVTLQDGTSFRITSLVIPGLNWPFEFEGEAVRGRFLPWPSAKSRNG